jgi:hypothetical protein
MTSRDEAKPRIKSAVAGTAGAAGTGRERMPDLIDDTELFRAIGDAASELEADDDSGEFASVPAITRLPEGIEVLEQRVGRAVGQWVLQVRCQCGRRWFELEAIDSTTCPRCGLFVYLDVEARPRPR